MYTTNFSASTPQNNSNIANYYRECPTSVSKSINPINRGGSRKALRGEGGNEKKAT